MRTRVLGIVLVALSLVNVAAAGKDREADGKKTWEPTDIDAFVPSVDTSHPCPLPAVLDVASRQVRKLVENLQQFSAREKLEYWELNRDGQAGSVRTATFTYVADIHEVRPGQYSVDEYRNDWTGDQSFPSRFATMGTAAFALIFHPFYIGDFNITCEGLAQVDGHPAWQVHFAQTRPNNFRYYRAANNLYKIELKGRAWIAQDTHQVIRLETDLLHPIHEVRLTREHVVIDYGPVHFRRHDQSLWLPQTATIHMDSRGHHYLHRHSFSDFKLFSVDTQQTAKVPENR